MMTISAALVAGPRAWSAPASSTGRPGRRSSRRPSRPHFQTPVAALAALVDNARDARAAHVDVIVREDARGAVAAVAVLDDGVGMVPEMVRAACAPGSSCRLGDGPHFARDGQGLPAAPFAIGDRFTLMSRPAGGRFAGVSVARGLAGPAGPATAVEPPAFVQRRGDVPDWRTVLVIEPSGDLGTAEALRRRLRADLAFLFGRLGDDLRLSVDGAPLRIRPDFPRPGPCTQWAGPFGLVSVSSAFLPALRGAPPSVEAGTAQRWGLIGARLGRRLGPVRDNPLWRTLDGDQRWRMDLDFSPDADAVVRPTRRLDAIDLDPAVWSWLAQQGLATVITRLRDASS